jgi:excisionase family DNA binding protein
MFTEVFIEELAARVAAKVVMTLQPQPQNRLMDLKTAAEYMGCTVSALRQAANNGKVPRTKLGKRIMFDRERLDRFIEEHTI